MLTAEACIVEDFELFEPEQIIEHFMRCTAKTDGVATATPK